jgi:chromosome segregation ATPase
MAAQPYIQTAVAELQRAVADIQQQIHGLEHGSAEQKAQLTQEMQEVERRFKADEVVVAQGDSNSTEIHLLIERVKQLKGDHEAKKSELARVDAGVRDQIQRKTGFMKQLQDEMARLNSMMASPDAH